jgi:transcriptional regulator CtsR
VYKSNSTIFIKGGKIKMKNKLHILNLIIDMWDNNIINENGIEDFENWCDDNIENEEQRELLNLVKNHVDAISYTLAEF